MARVVIIAGERSGDQLGAGLIRALKDQSPDIEISGVAGDGMRAAGCDSWFDCEDLAVMGLFEVLRHLPRILNRMREVERRILADPPDLVIGIDAPDFNLRVERKVKAAGIPTMHYVSPSVWAWRSGRTKTIRAAADHVLCLLPFEARFLHEHDISAEFVGHPLADEIPEPRDKEAARAELGLTGGPVVGLVPGSRLGEISRVVPAYVEAAERILEQHPDAVFVAPMVSPAAADLVRNAWQARGLTAPLKLLDGQPRLAMAAADVLLITSGTATLEAMLVGTPMVVAYRAAALSAWLVQNFDIINVKYFSLPNLLADEEVVVELFQDAASPERLAAEALKLLDNESGEGARMRQRFADLQATLAQDASATAARAVLNRVGKNA